MKKIISLFQRNYDGDRLVRNEVTPGAEWVLAGEGVPTRKFDGTCCMVREGRLFKRFDVKSGRRPPPNFEPAQDSDPVTGHWPGWVPVGDGPDDRWHRDAFGHYSLGEGGTELPDGTYELCGPKIQGDPEGFGVHVLVPHGKTIIVGASLRSFDEIREFLLSEPDRMEGIVWHHPDGRMVKIKRRDFAK